MGGPTWSSPTYSPSASLARRNPARDLAETDAVFGALAHASRRQILLVLKFHGGRMTAGDIARRFSCSWPTTTRHLQRLEEAGLVDVEKDGRERIYVLDERHLRTVLGRWLGWLDARSAP